jgi:hypothetical protein
MSGCRTARLESVTRAAVAPSNRLELKGNGTLGRTPPLSSPIARTISSIVSVPGPAMS